MRLAIKKRTAAKKASQEQVQLSGLTASQHLSEMHDGRFSKSLIWAIAFALIAFVYWSALTPVYEIVSGNGTIRPDGLATRIEHLEGGVVTEINVEEGDFVEAGQVLMRLDNQDTLAELEKTNVRLGQLNQSITRYQELLRLHLSSDLTPTLKEVDDPAFLGEVGYRLAQIRSIRAERSVVEAQQSALLGQISSVQAELDIQQSQFQRYQEAATSNAVSLNRREELQRENLRLEAAISQLEGETRIQSAQLDQLDQREAELVAQYRREAALRLEEQLTERAALNQTREQLTARLERTIIRVAVTGIVNGLSVQNLGEVVAAGEVLAEIVPAGAQNFAEIEIGADRIGGVSVGSEASLKILTFDFTRYGDITARVERISPSSFQKENGESVFRVRLGFDNATTRGSGPRQEVSPGMTVVADIKSERRTILSYLLKPVRVIADRALTEA